MMSIVRQSSFCLKMTSCYSNKVQYSDKDIIVVSTLIPEHV